MLQHRLRRAVWHWTQWRSQRDRLDFHHGLLAATGGGSFSPAIGHCSTLHCHLDDHGTQFLHENACREGMAFGGEVRLANESVTGIDIPIEAVPRKR